MWIQGLFSQLQLFLELQGSLPDLSLDSLLLSQSQTPERPLGDLGSIGVLFDLAKEHSVELPLHVKHCRGLSDLSADCTFWLLDLFFW